MTKAFALQVCYIIQYFSELTLIPRLWPITEYTTLYKSFTNAPIWLPIKNILNSSIIFCFVYLLLTLVLDSLYHRLISMPPEMSMANPPWNSTLAFRPDCSWITWRVEDERERKEGKNGMKSPLCQTTLIIKIPFIIDRSLWVYPFNQQRSLQRHLTEICIYFLVVF